MFGDTQGEEVTYRFTETKKFLGYDGVVKPDGHIHSLSVISFFTNQAWCVPDAPVVPPEPEPEPVKEPYVVPVAFWYVLISVASTIGLLIFF